MEMAVLYSRHDDIVGDQVVVSERELWISY